jgi:DNA-binding CsgD family transcriptional regulator
VVRSAARLLLEAQGGRGGALFVVGEPGLGKTVVLDECCKLAGADFKIGLARGDPMETLLPFGMLGQAFEGMGGGRLLEPTPAGESGADRRSALFYTVLRWFDRQAGPLLFALDDLHWADDDSLAMLSFLCRRLARLPVVLIGSLRPWPAAAHEVAQRLARSDSVVLEHLQPLSEPVSGAMLSDRVGRHLSEALRAQAWRLTGGNPLLLEQVALVIRQGEDLPEAVPGALQLADEMLLARFAGLPASGIQLARAASVLGVHFRTDVAAEVAQLGDAEADVFLDAIWRLGLVRETGVPGVAEFVHPLFHQALYADLGAPLRARLHARAFSALTRRGAEAEAVQHAIRGGLVGNAEAIGVLERAGRAALRTGAFEAAAEHLTAAVELAGDRSTPELKLVLSEVLLAGGRPAQAIEASEAVLAHPEASATARIHALRMLGRGLFITGHPEQAAARFEEAAPLAQAHDLDAAVQILLDHALSSWLTGGPARSLPLAQRARQLARTADQTVRRAAEATWGFIALQAGDGAGFEATAAAAEPVEKDPMAHLQEVSWTWGPLGIYGIAATDIEQFETADRVFRVALDAAESAGAAEAIASLRVTYGLTLARMGRLEEALGLIDAASDLFDLVPVAEAYAGAGRAHILQLMGRLDESREWFDRTEPRARARGEWVALLLLWDVQGHRQLREGRLEEAIGSYRRLEAATERLGIGEPCLVPWARHAINAYLAAGRPADALRVVEWLERCAKGLPCRWPRIVALTGRAALDALGGARDAAEDRFIEALRLHQGLGLGIQEVETLLQYGVFLRRSGLLTRARQVLADAAGLADATGAHWLERHARAELVVAGGRRRRRKEPEQLTPQERRVAELAAAGLSNKEIANQLFLAVSTVESHLQQVYGKLAITSRRQLMTMPPDRISRNP